MMLGSEFGDVDESVLKQIMLIQLERSVEDPLIWGGISINHRTNLVILQPRGFTVIRYINEVLRPCVIPMR